jgi:hypothetical protein
MSLGQNASDAERSADVLTTDQDVHQTLDRPSAERIGRGVPEGFQNNLWVLLWRSMLLKIQPIPKAPSAPATT